jgi:Raf kinase inhibitor-like YbhB/YbcL family protein
MSNMTPPLGEPFKSSHFKPLTVTSHAFKEGDPIPSKYTCDGKNINPPLDIENIPPEAKCLAIIVDDPDAPKGTWVHWVVWNIPVTHHIPESKIPGNEGINDSGQNHYHGPCPPSGTHRYFFKVYALNELIDLPGTADKKWLEKAMANHIIAFGEIMGVYHRK